MSEDGSAATPTLAKAFWEAVAQIELNAGEAFDLDSAMQCLEYLSGYVEGLGARDKQALVDAAAALARAEAVPERRAFFAVAAESFDLTS